MLPLLRYTLDLFASDPVQSPLAQAPKARSRQRSTPPSPPPSAPLPAVAGAAQQPAAPKPPYEAGQSLPSVLDPARFAHPEANREVRLGPAVVAYAFTRAKRKSIGFVVGADGLVVRAPRWTPLYEVDAALQEKSGWILRKLQEARERQQRAHSAQVQWRDGVNIPFLGQSLAVVLDPAHGFGGKGAQLHDSPEAPGVPTLHVGLPHSASAAQIRDAVQAWLMRQAQAFFKQRMDHFAPLLGVQWTRLRLSSAGTRWGSASADGSIRLNWRLIHFRQPVIDYVVAHELSHLRVMDHSPQFWNTVATVVPDYQQVRAELKEDGVPKW